MTITDERAREAARRLIAGAFRRDGERLADDKRPRFSIPTRIEKDDDTVIVTYIEQQQRLATDIARIRSEAVAAERERCARVLDTCEAALNQVNPYDMAKGAAQQILAAHDAIRLFRAAAIRGGADKPRYRHLKRGTTYRLVGQARVQTDAPLSDMDEVTVYRCEQAGDLWARRRSEFEDGRFEKIGGANDPR